MDNASCEIAQDIRVCDFVVGAVITHSQKRKRSAPVMNRVPSGAKTMRRLPRQQHFHVFEPFFVVAQPRAGYTLFTHAHGAAFGDGGFPDVAVEDVERPDAGASPGGGAK